MGQNEDTPWDIYDEVGKMLETAAGNERDLITEKRSAQRRLRRLQQSGLVDDPSVAAQIRDLSKRLVCLELAIFIMRIQGQDYDPAVGRGVLNNLHDRYGWLEDHRSCASDPDDLNSEDQNPEEDTETLDQYFNPRTIGRKKSINAKDCTLPTGKEWKTGRRKTRNYSAEF
jgi:hypothetical protein